MSSGISSSLLSLAGTYRDYAQCYEEKNIQTFRRRDNQTLFKGWNENNQGGSRHFYKWTNSELLDKDNEGS